MGKDALAQAAVDIYSESRRVYAAIPELGRLRDDLIYGEVWQDPALSVRDRSLITCAMLAALGRSSELQLHVGRAYQNGVNADELRALAVHAAFYAGWPAALALGRAALPVLEEDPGEG